MNIIELRSMATLHGGSSHMKVVKIPPRLEKYNAVVLRQIGQAVWKDDGSQDFSGLTIERGFCTYIKTLAYQLLPDEVKAQVVRFKEYRNIPMEWAMGCFVVERDGVQYQASQYIWVHSDKCAGACQWDTTSGA